MASPRVVIFPRGDLLTSMDALARAHGLSRSSVFCRAAEMGYEALRKRLIQEVRSPGHHRASVSSSAPLSSRRETQRLLGSLRRYARSIMRANEDIDEETLAEMLVKEGTRYGVPLDVNLIEELARDLLDGIAAARVGSEPELDSGDE